MVNQVPTEVLVNSASSFSAIEHVMGAIPGLAFGFDLLHNMIGLTGILQKDPLWKRAYDAVVDKVKKYIPQPEPVPVPVQYCNTKIS